MQRVTQRTQAGGNTNPACKRPERGRKYCFTYNNYTETQTLKLIKDIEALKGRLCIGKEVGEEGTPHLQGYVEFTNPINFDTLKMLNVKIHWERCKGTTEQNVAYCSKGGKVVINTTGVKAKRALKEIVLWLKWQEEVERIVKEEADDRTVHWYWEEKGNTGKTTLARYLSRKYGAVPLEGKKDNILHCAAEHEADIYIYDIERSLEGFVSYGAIEKIKNGYYMTGKYESKPIDRNPPHVFIFANFRPDMKKLSPDRWHIVKIDPISKIGRDEGSDSVRRTKVAAPLSVRSRGITGFEDTLTDDSTETCSETSYGSSCDCPDDSE